MTGSVDYTGRQLGKYRLIHKIGMGGFADVYLGEHIVLDSRAAVKVLHSHLKGDEVDKFLIEARMLANLKHHHIVQVYDFEVPSGLLPPFLIMEYAAYGTLSKILGNCNDPVTILPYIKQIAGALQHVHSHNLLHLDIKPENILLRDDSEALLSDFGIARAVQGAGQQGMQELLGTPDYMAPEHLQKQPCPASDQYSLGIIVYELLSGICPFTGSTREIIRQQLNDQPPPLHTKISTISSMVEAVIHKALDKYPHQRFASVHDFAIELEQAIFGARPAIVSSSPPSQSATPNQVVISPTALSTSGSPAQSAGPAVTHILPQPGGISKYRTEATVYMFKGHEKEVYSVTWSHDSKYLASASADRTVRVWNVAAKSIEAVYKHARPVKIASWSPDGTRIASMISNQSVQVMNGRTGDILVTYTGHVTKGTGFAFALAWSPDSRYLASSGDSNNVHVWKASSGNEVSAFYGHESWIAALAWSPDGQLLASGSEDKTMQVWEAFSGKKVLSYDDHVGEVCAVAWSPDGKLLATASRDKIKVWSTDKNELLTVLEHHKGVNALAWSPDSKFIASAGNDRTVEAWEIGKQQKVFTYIEHVAPVRSVAWSPDGKYLASGDEDSMVCLWLVK